LIATGREPPGVVRGESWRSQPLQRQAKTLFFALIGTVSGVFYSVFDTLLSPMIAAAVMRVARAGLSCDG